ncbi:MAG: bifunctional DNA primase/polymerase, partial [Verrucomicrobiota bacterium]
MNTKQQILEAIRGGESRARAIADKLGVTRSAVSKVVCSLVDEGSIVKRGRQFFPHSPEVDERDLVDETVDEPVNERPLVDEKVDEQVNERPLVDEQVDETSLDNLQVDEQVDECSEVDEKVDEQVNERFLVNEQVDETSLDKLQVDESVDERPEVDEKVDEPLVIPGERFPDLLAAARYYRERLGWVVHPLHGPNEGTEKERGKKPRLRGWKKLRQEDCDAGFIEKHFGGASTANLGVVVKPPHIVIDLDSKSDKGESVRAWLEAQPGLADLPRERTAGGCHLHLLCHDVPEEATEAAGRNQKLSATLAKGVTAEIFLGGNVVLAPSTHKSGLRYCWEVAGELPTLKWEQIASLFFSNQPLEAPAPAKRGRPKKEPPYWARYQGDLRSLDIVALAKHLGLYGQPISGEEGKHSIRCPWRDQHSDCATHWTPGDSSTVIWQGKPGHFPNFFCSHTSHGEKTLADLLAWAEAREPGVIDRFCRQQRIWKPGQHDQKKRRRILLPSLNRRDAEFATEVGSALKDKAHWFDKSSVVVEVRKVPGEGCLFVPLKPAAAVTSLEVHAQPGVLVKADTLDGSDEYEFYAKSMSQAQATVLLESAQLKQQLPQIERIFQVPLPILKKDGSIVTPKRGY